MSSVLPATSGRPADGDDPIQRLGPWFHNIHLPDGRQTFPDHWLGDFPRFKWAALAGHLPADLSGWSCLDIGCNAGFYSVELARRGGQVLGIDLDERYLEQARWVADQFDLSGRLRFARLQVYDLARLEGQFDLILFMGVFYHLRYPMLGLDIVAQRVRRLMVFQTLLMPGEEVAQKTWGMEWEDRGRTRDPGWPKMAFLEHGFAGDPTNWWVANHAGVEAMLRSAGLRITARPMEETCLCAPDPDRPSAMATWNRAEYLAAVGGSRSPEC